MLQQAGRVHSDRYRHEIDGLRAIAVAAVIAHHIHEDILPSGFLGVDVFFVISGYVVLSSMMGYRSGSLPEFIFTFYGRRIRRLLPALIFFVAICGTATCLVLPDAKVSITTGVISLFGSSNIYLFFRSLDYFEPSAQYNTFTHTWSLGIEEQFYLLFPLLVYFSIGRRKTSIGTSGLLGILLGLALLSFFYRKHISETDPTAAFFLLPARFWELAVGGATFLVVRRYAKLTSNQLRKLTSPLLLALLILAFFAPAQNLLLMTTACVVTTSAVLFVTSSASLASGVLSLAPLRYVGKISYSLYLWHWGIVSLGRWLGYDTVSFAPQILVLIFGAAAISYHFVEAPFRKPAETANPRIMTYGFAASGALAILLYAAVNPLEARRQGINAQYNKLSISPEPIIHPALECHLPDSASPLEQCLAPARDSDRRTVFIIGDSHASNHVPSVTHAVGTEADVRYLIEWGFIHSLLGAPRCESHSNRPCLDQGFSRQLEFLSLHLKPKDVVIFSWARDRVVHKGPLPRRPNHAALRTLEPFLVQLRHKVAAAGAKLVLVEDIPKPCSPQVAWQIIYATGKHELCAIAASVSKKDRAPLSELFAKMKDSNVYIFDPHDYLCPNGVCGIYDPASQSMIYGDNSPHFTQRRPAPLAKEWSRFLSTVTIGSGPLEQ